MASGNKQGLPVVPGRKQQTKVQTKGWETVMKQKAYEGSLKKVGNHLNQPKQYLFIDFFKL